VHDGAMGKRVLTGGLNRCAAEIMPVVIIIAIITLEIAVAPGGKFEDDGMR
jgi:hypothetical protein